MIAKNIKGKSFGGCVRYVMLEPRTNSTTERMDAESWNGRALTLLEAEGVFADSAQSIIRSFQMQRSQRNEIKQPVGHIPIAFSPEDSHRMTNEFMLQLAKEYMNEMGIGNTQYIIVRHHNTDHDHMHIVYNRIDNDLKLISVNNDYKRNIAVCKKLKDRHYLTYGKGKENVNREKLHGRDEVKYEIYDSIRKHIPQCTDYQMLINCLAKDMIFMDFKLRRGTDIIEGVSFSKDSYSFKGSEIDRKFSHKGLVKLFMTVEMLKQQAQQMKQERQTQQRKQEELQQQLSLQTRQEQQKQSDKQPQQQSQPERQSSQSNPEGAKVSSIPTSTPTVKGIKLTEKQWYTLKTGGHIYLKDMLSTQGKRFDGYVFMDDRQKMFLFSKSDPDTFVKYGKYEMRERDKRLIEAGCVTRAVVKWWGGTGQLAYPYLWKPNPEATNYAESWSDPREPDNRQSTSRTVASQSQNNTQSQSSARLPSSGELHGDTTISTVASATLDVATNVAVNALNAVGSVTAGIASALSEAIDNPAPDSDFDPDEAESRRLQKLKKKKKRGRSM